MPIPTDDTASSSTLPEQAPLAPNETDNSDAITVDENASEIAKRISLLGKLIIPPAAP